MTKDYGKYFGSILMFGFGVFAFYRWHQTNLIFFLLLVLRDFTAGYFFLRRKSAKEKSSIFVSTLAYLSAAMPLIYFSPSEASKTFFLVSDLLSIIGFVLVVFATIELGTSIGISPANRSLVLSGIYSLLKHPMYLGYVISEAGLVLLNPLNTVLLGISVALYTFRAKSENRILNAMSN